MFDALDRGEIKAIWIIGTNPAASMPNLPKVRRALEQAELVIVQDAYYPTETTPYAHVLLPAAVNFEQDGTFCNSERRVTLMEQVVPPPGDARPDWWWVREVAEAMGFERGMAFDSAAADLRRVRPHHRRPAQRPERPVPRHAPGEGPAAVALPGAGAVLAAALHRRQVSHAERQGPVLGPAARCRARSSPTPSSRWC